MILDFRVLCFNFLIILSLVMTGTLVDGYVRFKNKHDNNLIAHDLKEDDALFLTPYLEKKQIKKAQELAIVPPFLKGVESFSGFLTVNKSCSSNLFFWLFKSQLKNWEEQPLLVWLAGGPGGSSVLGMLMELGPFSVNKKQKLKKRKYSWNRKYNLVFIDNPVGAGFSFTKSDAGYAKSEVDVARDLYEALVQLYTLFPALQTNKLFITGESYAGKYIPAIGYKIYETNKISSFKLPLAGLLIGNGWTDPYDMHEYAAYLYQLGLVDRNQKEILTKMEDDIRADIRADNLLAAADDDLNERRSIAKMSGLHAISDFVNDYLPSKDPEITFINAPKTRIAIHVGDYSFNNGSKTLYHLKADWQQSVKPWVEALLTAEQFPILFFSGQLDIIVAYPLSLGFYQSLRWPRAKDYHSANRCQFKVGKEVAGYYKTAGTFTEILVRNAGHKVPIKQPKWAYEILDRFVTNITSFQCN